jgi:hypothetical protein
MLQANEDHSERHVILEQYKLYVEMADRISDRRQTANSFYLALNASLTSFYGLTATENSISTAPGFLIVLALAGVAISYTWHRGIRSYRDINGGKFAVIHEIEKKLPIAPYTDEWQILGEGRDRRVYLPFTNIERWVPWAFVILYLLLVALSVMKMLYPALGVFES